MVERGVRARKRQEGQRAFWTARYGEDPSFFGDRESEFVRWCLPRLRSEPGTREILELGCGYGRDTKFLASQGFHVRGVDLVGPPTVPGDSSDSLEFVEADSFEYLRSLPAKAVDAVYSNMFFNMDFTEAEHRELMVRIHRVLRPQGRHFYSARSTSDPWYGRGKKVGPDTFDPAPHGITMHYFSAGYADRLAKGLFEPVVRQDESEGEGEFPIRLLYVEDRKRG